MQIDMNQLFQEAFATENIVLTVLLALLLMYWLLVIIGGLDIESLDFDFDADMDVDLDADLDLDVDADGADGATVGGGFWISTLQFFNVGEAPLMIILTVLVTCMWAISILSNYYLNDGSLNLAAVFLLANFVGSLFITKIITTPIARLYRKIKSNYAEAVDYLGRTGKAMTPLKGDRLGQAEIIVENSSLRINVKSIGGIEIERNSDIEVVGERPDEGYYLIKKTINI